MIRADLGCSVCAVTAAARAEGRICVQPTDRFHALDAARAYALLLGVVLHSAVPFLANVEVPLWRDEPHAGPAVIYYVTHMFRMPAFFLMAGLFVRVLSSGAVRPRSSRIGRSASPCRCSCSAPSYC